MLSASAFAFASAYVSVSVSVSASSRVLPLLYHSSLPTDQPPKKQLRSLSVPLSLSLLTPPKSKRKKLKVMVNS